ncbi:MAG: polysaccharide autokinase-like protein HfsB [Hyphomonadaceae bacterium]|nr:MAG: polysaccharide autokinase-like protein HfsB [Hyphomonadaceae bacterium]
MGISLDDLQNVWSALAGATSMNGATIMFIGARLGDGTSDCAQNFAKLAATRAERSVWLIDLDFFVDKQFSSLGGANAKWQGPFDMAFGKLPFWRAIPRTQSDQGEGALVSYRVGKTKLFVSRFRREALQSGQSIQVGPAPDYWRTIRASIDVTVIDAPALEKSRSGLALCAEMDGVVLVVNSDGDPRDAIDLRDEVLNRGGRILGVVVVNGRTSSRNKSAANKNRHPSEQNQAVADFA